MRPLAILCLLSAIASCGDLGCSRDTFDAIGAGCALAECGYTCPTALEAGTTTGPTGSDLWSVTSGSPGGQVTGTLTLDNGGPGGPAMDAYAPIVLSEAFVADASARDAASPFSSAEGRFVATARSQAPSWAPIPSGDVSGAGPVTHCREVLAPNPFGKGRVECDLGDGGTLVRVDFMRLDENVRLGAMVDNLTREIAEARAALSHDGAESSVEVWPGDAGSAPDPRRETYYLAHCHEVDRAGPLGRAECEVGGNGGWHAAVNFTRLDGGPW
jgi:hypothetical protein